MPAYTAKVVSDEELGDIYAYLQSLPPAKPVRDIPLLKSIKDRQ
jgi:mono/diheme cytochrome c family protein